MSIRLEERSVYEQVSLIGDLEDLLAVISNGIKRESDK